jgi:hypothetical protein
MQSESALSPKSGLGRFFLRRCLPYVAAWILVGIIVWFCMPPLPQWMNYPGLKLQPNHLGRLLALYAFLIAGSTLIINPLIAGIRKLFKLDAPDDVLYENIWPAMLVGSCEAVLYPTSLIINKPEFIGVWLALKVAGHWKFWEEGHKGRNRFNMFLIGNSFSIVIAFLGSHLIRALVFIA